MALDISRFEQHLKKSGIVRYVYKDHSSSLVNDELRVGTSSQSSYSSKDFEAFFQECISGFNNGYRIYMQNLFGKEILYPNLPLNDSSKKVINAVLSTDDMSHAFGLPNYKTSRTNFVNKKLFQFFEQAITKEDGNFVLVRDNNMRNPDIFKNIPLDLQPYDENIFSNVKSSVDAAKTEISRLIALLNGSTGIANLNFASTYETALKAIHGIVFDGYNGSPSLISLVNQYYNVEGVNAYLLETLLNISDAYNKLLEKRKEATFSYDIVTGNVHTTPLFISWISGKIVQDCKQSPANLKVFLKAMKSEKDFIDYVDPFLIEINANFAPNCSLEIIRDKVKNSYQDIILEIRKSMNEIYINSKDKSSIKVDANIDNAFEDEELKKSVKQSNLLKIDFMKYCASNGFNPISERFAAAALYYDEVDKEDFTLEHWESLMFEYFEGTKYVESLNNKLNTIKTALDDLANSSSIDEIEYDDLQSKADYLTKLIDDTNNSLEDLKIIATNYANYYKDILISRELNSVQLLDEEIDKFIRAQKGTLKDYPILSSFFNGIKKGTIPLFEHLPSYVAQNVSADIFNDKTFQGDIDKIFECSEKIRGQIFIADLEKAISTVQQNNNGILKNDLVLKVCEILIKKYDFPYIFKMMLDSPYMKNHVFKEDFINSNESFNWVRIAEKSKVMQNISTAMLESPMIKRIDGSIMSNFMVDSSNAVILGKAPYDKSLRYMIGYIIQIPTSKNTADLLFIQPTPDYNSPSGLVEDNHGNIVFHVTHFFKNQELSSKLVDVIAQNLDNTYGLKKYDIGEGHVVSYGIRPDERTSAFKRDKFFPSFNLPYPTINGTVSLSGVSQSDLELFELMRSGQQIVTSFAGKVSELEKEKLKNLYEIYEIALSI